MTTGALAAAIALALSLTRFMGPAADEGHEPSAQHAVVGPPSPIQFRDGSTVRPLDGTTQVIVKSVGDEQTLVDLQRGSAHFSITPNSGRDFIVEAGDVRVVVLGTEFDCWRVDDRVSVQVHRGKVRVSWTGGASVLVAGDERSFPPLRPAEHEQPDPPPTVVPDPHKPSEPKNHPSSKATNKGAAGAGTKSSASTLMVAADTARAQGRPRDALPLLEQVIQRYPHDLRAAPAAFTMGRIQMDLGQAAAAAASFARARRLGAATSLAEHALAREVEAWATAGKPDRAQSKANEYLHRFPRGPRANEVRRILE